MNLLVEEWGGKYQCQEISAKKGIGISDLMEKVLLEAEMLDLKANPNRKATGSIIESSLDKGRGYVSTVLVSNGTLRVGDNIIAGTSWGRIKAMFNERNQRIQSAGPAEPAIILGLNGARQPATRSTCSRRSRRHATSPTSVCSCSASRACAHRSVSPSLISLTASLSVRSRSLTSSLRVIPTVLSRLSPTRSSRCLQRRSRWTSSTRQ